MVDATEWRTRAATLADAEAIEAIAATYDEGIADRIATFETEAMWCSRFWHVRAV
jgi:hypothetical protein